MINDTSQRIGKRGKVWKIVPAAKKSLRKTLAHAGLHEAVPFFAADFYFRCAHDFLDRGLVG